MVLPRSRKSAPGLQSLIEASRDLRAARMTRCESSSTRPTGYVSFRSAWKPTWLISYRARREDATGTNHPCKATHLHGGGGVYEYRNAKQYGPAVKSHRC